MPRFSPPHGAYAPPFQVHYLPQTALYGWLAQEKHILGVVGFGAARPDILPPDCPYVATPLPPIVGEARFEIWTASSPVQPCDVGAVTGSFNDAIAFGAIPLAEGASLEAATERAYLDIFDFLQRSGHNAPIRFWNYPVAITADDNGMERYRRFNIGRHRAFTTRLQQNLPPAASGVGGHAGASVIYFLAAREPAMPVENPRQISAYAYPPIYGPRSPSFSRASIYTQNEKSCLFISGTASIVGHETQHVGDLSGQIAETAENLRAVIAAADRASEAKLQGAWAVKIYLHDPVDQQLVAPVIDRIFGANAQRIYLRGEICRRELLMEIEAFRQF